MSVHLVNSVQIANAPLVVQPVNPNVPDYALIPKAISIIAALVAQNARAISFVPMAPVHVRLIKVIVPEYAEICKPTAVIVELVTKPVVLANSV
jgi:hypothetical protein